MSTFSGRFGGGGSPPAPTRTPDTLRSRDSVEVVLGIAEGEIKGLKDGEKSFFIGDTPLVNANGEVNYQTFELNLFPGEAYPDPVRFNLGGVTQSTTVNTSLRNETPVVRTTQRGDLDRLEVRLNISQLYEQNDKGVFEHELKFKLQYKPQSGSSWLPFAEQAEIAITGKTSTPYLKEIGTKVSPIDEPYEIRIIKTSSESDTEFFTEVAWESFQEVISGPKQYPNTAVVQAYGESSDQFSSIPQFSGVYQGRLIRVPSNYDPVARTYSGLWDGTWKLDYTNNPVWCLYDFIMNDRFGVNAYYQVNADRFDFYDAAVWCDEPVPSLDGGTEPRFTLNHLITEASNGRDMARWIAGVFNAVPYDDLNGTVHLKFDQRDEQAVALFTPENVVDGAFEYSYTDISSRVNDITATFINPSIGWSEDRRRVFDREHIDKHGRIPLDFAAIGCTGAGEAIRRAKYKLMTGLTETEQVSFKTNRQGQFVAPFEVILVADPTMDTSITGRIKSGAAETTVELFEPIHLEAGVSYSLQVETPDGIFETSISTATTGDHTSIPVADVLPPNTPEYATFSLGAEGFYGLPKPYRVLSIAEASSDDITITALEVNRAKWDIIDDPTAGDVDVVDETQNALPNPREIPPSPVNLQVAYSVAADPSGTTQSVELSWENPPEYPFRAYYIIEVSENGGPFTQLTITGETSASLIVRKANYIFRVFLVNTIGLRSKPAYAARIVDEQDVIETVTINGLELENQGNNTTFAGRNPRFVWRASSTTGSYELGSEPQGADSGFLDFIFRDYLVEILDPANGEVVFEDITSIESYTFQYEDNANLPGGPFREFGIRVSMRDKWNRLSTPGQITVVNPPPAIPTQVTLFGGTEFVGGEWDPAQDLDYDGTVVHLSQTDGFTPDKTTLSWEGRANKFFIHGLDTGAPYYARIGHFDAFSKTGLNFTDQLDATPSDPEVTGDNLDFELGDTGWALQEAGWSIIESPSTARRGSWHASRTGTGSAAIRNDKRFKTTAGERHLIIGFLRADGADGKASIRISYRDKNDVEVDFIDGTNASGELVTGADAALTYTESRVLLETQGGLGIVEALIEFAVYDQSVGTWYADDAGIAQIAADGDIDALKLLNHPAAAGADVTGAQTQVAILNPNFESGSVDWTSDAGAWDVISSVGESRGGTFVARWQPAAGSNDAFRNEAVLPIGEGEKVILQAFVRAVGGTDGSCGIRVSYRSALEPESEVDFLQSDVVTNTTSQWQSLRVVGITPTGVDAKFAVFEFVGYGGSQGTWYADNAQMFWAGKDTDIDGPTVVEGATDQIAVNPGFEAGPGGWIGDLGIWKVVHDETNSRSGKWVGKRVADGTTPTEALRNTSIFPVEPGDRVTVAGFLKSSSGTNGQAVVRISWRDENKNEVALAESDRVSPTTSYVQSRKVIQAPANAVFGVLEYAAYNHTTGVWYADDGSFFRQPKDAADIPYTDGTSVDSLKPLEAFADVTANAAQVALRNPNFDQGDEGWEADNAVWQIVNDPANARGSDWVARARKSGTLTTAALRNMTVLPVVEGDQMVMRAFFRGVSGANGDVGIRVSWRTGVGASSEIGFDTHSPAASNGDWEEVRNFATVPSGQGIKYVALELYVIGITSGTWYVDNASMYEVQRTTEIDAIDTLNGPAEPGADSTLTNADQIVANPGFESGGLHWESDLGIWQVVQDPSNARFGEWIGKRVGSSSDPVEALRNKKLFRTSPGERLIARAFIRSNSSANGSCAARISWRDANATEVTVSAVGNIFGPQTSWTESRTIVTTPNDQNIVYGVFEYQAIDHTSGTWMVDDGFFARVPKDVDIDALQITNGPAQAGADVTGANTAANIAGQGTLATKNDVDFNTEVQNAPIINAGQNAYLATGDAATYTTTHKAGTLLFEISASTSWPTDDGMVITYWANSSNAKQIVAASGVDEEWTRFTNDSIYPAWSIWRKMEIFSASDVDVLQTANAPTQAGADVTGSNTALAILNQGALATMDSIDFSDNAQVLNKDMSNLTNRLASLIDETSGRYFAVETGADKTSNNTASGINQQGNLATLNAAKLGDGTVEAQSGQVIYDSDLVASFNKISDSNIGSFMFLNAILADYINVGQLSAITADVGSITAGTIEGLYIEGAEFRTSATTNYIRIRDQELAVYSGNDKDGRLMTFGSGSGAYLYLWKNSTTTAHIQNANGSAIQAISPSDEECFQATGSVGVRGTGALIGVIGEVDSTNDFSFRADVNNNVGAGRVYASGGLYPFTGVHQDLIDKTETLVEGDIVVDMGTVMIADVVNANSYVTGSTQANQAGVVGVFVRRDLIGGGNIPTAMRAVGETEIEIDPDATDRDGNPIERVRHLPPDVKSEYQDVVVAYDVCSHAGVGEGTINVCGENGNMLVGDLIVASSTRGKGMKQADDIIRSYTVAKVRQAVNFDHASEIKQVACIYLCG